MGICTVILTIITNVSLFFAAFCTFILRCKKPQRCPPIEEKLLFCPAYELTRKIRKKELTCETVIKVYINRIKEVNPIINAVVENRFEAAIEEAKNFDKFLQTTDWQEEQLEIVYPLLGVPLTIKGSIAVKNMSHRVGVYDRHVIASQDAEIVAKARKAVAIILLTSNTPDYCTGYEARNHITGITKNPYDTRRTAGGSSGGEAALIGAGASLMGLGSDVAGSLRIPPNFCGVWGHKPSAYLVPLDGHFPTFHEESAIFAMGPITRYASDLPLLLNVILKDDRRKLLHLDKEINLKDIKVYYVLDEGLLLSRKMQKEIVDKIQETVFYFKYRHACDTKKLQFEQIQDLLKLSIGRIVTTKGIEHVFSDSKHSVGLELLKYITGTSKYQSMSLSFSLTYMMCNKLFSKETIDEWDEKIEQIKNNLMDILGENGVLLYPSYPTSAHFHGESFLRMADPLPHAIFNVLGFPVTNCPLGLTSNGMPFGIQVAAIPNNDKLTLKIAQALEQDFGGWTPPMFEVEENEIPFK